MLSDGGVEEESQLPRPLQRTPPSSEIGMINVQLVPVTGDEASPPLAPSSSEIGMKVQMIDVAGDEANPPLAPSSEIGMNVQMVAIAGDEASPPLAPSSSEIGMKVQMIAVAGDETYPPLSPASEVGMNIQMFSVSGDEAEVPPAPSSETGMDVQLLPEGGDEADRDPPLPPSETRINIQRLPDGGHNADRDPQLPRAVYRFMRYRIYASFPAMLGANIHVLADMMEPTTENKILIGLSMISLGGNVASFTWLIFREGDLSNVDWKNISFKITFVFTGTLTLYASFSTLAVHWFTLSGIALCGVLAVGLGHSDGINKLCKKFIATIKNVTQKIRELIA